MMTTQRGVFLATSKTTMEELMIMESMTMDLKKMKVKIRIPEVVDSLANTWIPLREYFISGWTNYHFYLVFDSTEVL